MDFLEAYETYYNAPSCNNCDNPCEECAYNEASKIINDYLEHEEERLAPEKPVKKMDGYCCCNCGTIVYKGMKSCAICRQKIDWDE